MASVPAPAEGDGETPVRDAACLILVDRSQDEPRFLLGRRLATQVFLPNKWVFPGGRVDDDDRTLALLLAGTAAAPGTDLERLPFALAAIRELLEETGIVFGVTQAPRFAVPSGWQAFAGRGQMPAYERLSPLARAITPPGFLRRFDTWFFLADHDPAVAPLGEPDGELLDIGWFALAAVRGLDLPYITRLIVDDAATALNLRAVPERPVIPFYFQDNDGYRRTLVDGKGPFLTP